MANGIFKLRKQILGVIQKAWPAVPTYSGLFNGTNQYLTTSSTSAFSFGSGNFTVEFWLNTDNTQTGNIINPNTGSSWGLLISAGNVLNWNNAYNVTSLFTVSASSISNSAWHHVALVRSSGTIYVYYDGVLQTSQADSTNYNASASTWSIGYGNVGYFKGYLSNLRITTTAVYTSAFTPPNTQLTAITGTQLLTLQNSTIVDNSPNALTITNNNAVTTPAQYFLPASKRTTDFVEYLVVAGGGSGGYSASSQTASGGGAGGLLTGIVPVTAGASYTVTVGAGGTALTGQNFGNNGVNSVFGSITATGGGGGGSYGNDGVSGGSGGGGGGGGGYPPKSVGQGVVGQGNKGGVSGDNNGAGGGGAGTVGLNVVGGANGSIGGAGIASAISGSVVVYAGGGGGGSSNAGAYFAPGGIGGGGNGGSYASTTAGAGTVNTGGGGGGGPTMNSGAGGSGIVIIRYPNTFADATSVTNGTKTSITGFTVYTFLSSGSITF